MNSTEVIQMTLPALCFKGMVVLPNNEIKIELGRADSARTIKEIMDSEDKLLVVLSKDEIKRRLLLGRKVMTKLDSI